MATYAEQLAEVQAAISKVLSGQSYEISDGGMSRRVQRADLAQLEAREKRLIPLAAQEARGRTGRRTRQIAPG
jgi:hypothetical protein